MKSSKATSFFFLLLLSCLRAPSLSRLLSSSCLLVMKSLSLDKNKKATTHDESKLDGNQVCMREREREIIVSSINGCLQTQLKI